MAKKTIADVPTIAIIVVLEEVPLPLHVVFGLMDELLRRAEAGDARARAYVLGVAGN